MLRFRDGLVAEKLSYVKGSALHYCGELTTGRHSLESNVPALTSHPTDHSAESVFPRLEAAISPAEAIQYVDGDFNSTPKDWKSPSGEPIGAGH